MRTDQNNNPTAFTIDIAKQAGLVQGVDYEVGSPFGVGSKYYTAKLLGNPIDITIRVIDTIGFFNKQGAMRWVYIGIPDFVWRILNKQTKVAVIYYMYKQEGGTQLRKLFN